MKLLYGWSVVKPKAMIKVSDGDNGSLSDAIPFRAAKGFIYGFYDPARRLVWIRIYGLGYGLEICRFKVRFLRATE